MTVCTVVKISLFLLILEPTPNEGAYQSYGPQFKATAGEVWPKPFQQNNTGRYFAVDPNKLKLKSVGESCDILEQALVRYTKIIQDSAQGYNRAPATDTVGTIKEMRVNLTRPCESLPHLDMDESYHIWRDGSVSANSIWGILRGLETLSQLLVSMTNGILRMTETEIVDMPRFKHRGLMLDSARHFVGKRKILQLIEAMSYNKLNVFHWHLTDDSAFTYRSEAFPELSTHGAYRPEMTFSQDDVKEVVEFARVRGVRVIPEFDTPAHTASWGVSHPELMTKCEGELAGQVGPFNPTRDASFYFLRNFFREIKTMFPDQYLHLGVDEVDSACWESNTQIQKYLRERGLDNGDLSYMYLERFSANISSLGWKQMMWQEAMTENNLMDFPAGTTAQVWRDYDQVMAELTKKNFDVVVSDKWYLGSDLGANWEEFYNVEPTDFKGSNKQKKHVIGGEACLWTEYINENNLMPTTFPSASAVAERLWSQKSPMNVDEARLRLEEHNCRMIWRGIEARPANGFGLC